MFTNLAHISFGHNLNFGLVTVIYDGVISVPKDERRGRRDVDDTAKKAQF